MAIVGISGSPIINGNIDRMTKALLEQSGRKAKFINLSTLHFEPCRACAHLCAVTNMCGRKDDLHPHLEDIRDADALVLSSPIHNSNMTGWMFSFVTRLWCFYHVKELLKDKPAVFVSTGIGDKRRQIGSQAFQDTVTHGHKLNVLGHIHYRSMIPPCLKCGAGQYCQIGGLWRMVGRNEEALKNFEFTQDKFRRWEDDPETVAKIKRYGEILSRI